jgi:hypothetical protein
MTPTSKPAAGRPAELTAFFAIAVPVYGWLVSDSVNAPHVLAVVLAVVAGLVPIVVSTIKDTRRPPDDTGDDVVDQLPMEIAPDAVEPRHELHGIDHAHEARGAG